MYSLTLPLYFTYIRFLFQQHKLVNKNNYVESLFLLKRDWNSFEITRKLTFKINKCINYDMHIEYKLLK